MLYLLLVPADSSTLHFLNFALIDTQQKASVFTTLALL